MVVEERYTEGIWYDIEGESFVRVNQQEDGAKLVSPDEDIRYMEWSEDEAAQRSMMSLIRVPEEAVENPVMFVEQILDKVQSEDYAGTSGPTHSEILGLRYAREFEVEITER